MRTEDEIRNYILSETRAAEVLEKEDLEKPLFWNGHRNAYYWLLGFMNGGAGKPVPVEPITPVLVGAAASKPDV